MGELKTSVGLMSKISRVLVMKIKKRSLLIFGRKRRIIILKNIWSIFYKKGLESMEEALIGAYSK